MIALGKLGSGNIEEAKTGLNKILDWDAMHFGAKTHLNLTRWLEVLRKKDDRGLSVYGTK